MPVSEHVIKSSLKAIEEPTSAHSVAHAPVVGEPSTSIAPIPQNDSRLISRRSSTAHGRLSTDSEGHHRSIFTHGEKWFIVAICGFAGTFSPLTSNIYFPALPTLASQFNVSVELINLTITVYMVMQAVAPSFWGTFADHYGRRPFFLACMLVLCLTCVGLALVPTNAYWLLMLLRCVQAAGSASTIALSAGVVADISEPHERGTFFGFMGIGPMVGPCLGPILGGALSQGLGWRSIFWFLAIASALLITRTPRFLPETLHSIVGDGSTKPSAIYCPLIPLVGRHRQRPLRSAPQPPSHDSKPKKPFTNPLKAFTHPDIVLILLYTGIINAASYSVSASISTLFVTTYPWLSQTDLGLVFLAMGGGMMAGSVAVGRFLDWEYGRVGRALGKKKETDNNEGKEAIGAVSDDAGRGDRRKEVEAGFPIEKARLRTMPFILMTFIACVVGYGWCLQAKVNMAGPLLLQIVGTVGFMVMAQMNTAQILLVDLFPTQGSTITACNNLVRSSLGAAFVSVIDLILTALHGPGWTFVLIAGICLVVGGPVLAIEMKWGPIWRERRRRNSIAVVTDVEKRETEQEA
ncbi:MFS general substrate transporter [Stereum hirsutum FP-91666 SS1]|uniref:MFS general substrate transporter n=1 Tax=Stereum hirsutum (strain FP-91666) TaxID=721885 RepID=R7RWZ8_STEHR|nr:MFS general substrate transporter [Stereum hirsutum FP-91666 SS1]EIM79911.1 MFS general substrate transporter [Stereum hirsutum FP-91666 SS1]